MFETAVLSYGPPTKRVWATFAGFAGQVTLIGCALLAPLLWPQVIPRVTWAIPIVGPPPPPPPPPPGGTVVPVHHARSYSQFVENVLRQPTKIPDKAIQLTDEEPVVTANNGDGVVGGQAGGQKGGVPGSVLLSDIMNRSRILPNAPVAEVRETVKTPPPPQPSKAPARISQIEPATPIRRVEPAYPPLAKAAGISGRVELLGVLGTDGRIHELKVVSGHPLLIQAAVDAVKQWIFAPTILNGQPVEVQAPIQVNFVLHR